MTLKLHRAQLLDLVCLIFPGILSIGYAYHILRYPLLAMLIPVFVLGFINAGHGYLTFLQLFNSQQNTINPLRLFTVGKIALAVFSGSVVMLFWHSDVAWGLVFYLSALHFLWQFDRIGRYFHTAQTEQASLIFALLLVAYFIAYHLVPYNELELMGGMAFEGLYHYAWWIKNACAILSSGFGVLLLIQLGRKKISKMAVGYYLATLMTFHFSVFTSRPNTLPFFSVIVAHGVAYLYVQFLVLKQGLPIVKKSAWLTLLLIFLTCSVLGGMDLWLSEVELDSEQLAAQTWGWGPALWENLVKGSYITIMLLHFWLDYRFWRQGFFAQFLDRQPCNNHEGGR